MKPGEKVRVHLSDAHDLDEYLGNRFRCGGHVIGQTPEHEGMTGEVMDCGNGVPCRDGSRLNHGVCVRYDRPYSHGDAICWGGHFPIEELEVIG